MIAYFALIVFFTYFYVSITFNPDEVADNMKKYGGFIPGIRAGRPTAEYLDYILTRITFPGALYLGAASSLIPLIALVAGQRRPELPVRRHVDPDHRRCRAGDREADRVPAAAAALRRVPALMRLLILGPPGAGKGTQAARLAQRTTASPPSRPATSSAATSRTAPSSASRCRRSLDAGELRPGRDHQRHGARPAGRSRTRARLPAGRLPAHQGPGGRAGQHARGARPALDDVVRADRRRRRGRPAAAQAGRDRGARRRHRGRHPPPPGGLRARDGAAGRHLPRARRCCVQVDGMGDVDEVAARLEAALAAAWTRRRDVRPPAALDDQDPRADPADAPGRAGRGGDARADAGAHRAPASPPPSWTPRRGAHPRPQGATPSFLGYPASPASTRACSRSTTRSCTASPGRACWPRATWSRSTAGRSSTAGTATPPISVVVGGRDAGLAGRPGAGRRDRGLDVAGIAALRVGGTAVRRGRRRRGHDRRRGAPAAWTTASSRTTSATASAPRCTRTRRCRTTACATAGPDVRPGSCVAIEPMLTLGQRRDPASWPTTGPSSPGRRPGRALGELRRGHRRRALGAHRPGRRARAPGGARRAVRHRCPEPGARISSGAG